MNITNYEVKEIIVFVENLSVYLIQKGPGCSSGWYLLEGKCSPDLETTALIEGYSYREREEVPLAHTPEPSTLLLLGTVFAVIGKKMYKILKETSNA